MFGIITLKGVQNKNKFVDELGREFTIINDWVDANYKAERYVQLRKFNDEAWFVLRVLEVSRCKIN